MTPAAATSATPPARTGRDGLRGDRALAVRVIGETGARAAGRPFADALHPPSRVPRVDLGLDRVPHDLARRALRKLDRVVVRYLGGALLRLRRVDDATAVAQVHALDHRCSELERRIAELEAGSADRAGT